MRKKSGAAYFIGKKKFLNVVKIHKYFWNIS